MQKVSENETIEDLVRELRGIKGGQHTNGGLSFERWRARCQLADDYADRFEPAHQREGAELRECLEQAYGDKIGTYTMKGNEVERWRKALREKGGAK